MGTSDGLLSHHVTATATTTPPAPPTVRPGPAILALAAGGFTIGTTEFMTMGVLPQIAEGVGVSVPVAGHVIAAYAVGVVVGVPVLAFFGAGLPRRAMLIGLMGAYAAFNLLSALAPTYEVLAVARFLDGLPHGAYFGVASLVAAGLVAPELRGRAVAAVMLGLSVANVVGVPVATWMGQNLGWRTTYLAGAALAAATVLAIVAVVPSVPGDPEQNGRAEAREFFGSIQVWLTMGAGAIGFGGIFAVYSYIAPTVTDVAGLGEQVVPVFVLALGLGMVVGTWMAGELVRFSVVGTLIGAGLGLTAVLVAFWALAPSGWWLLPAAFGVTATGSLLVIGLQLRLMDVAGGAVTLGAAMNHASLNIGNALGAWAGGVVITAGLGYRAPALVGVGLAAAGVVIVVLSILAQRRGIR